MAVRRGASASWPPLSTLACARAPRSCKRRRASLRWAMRPARADQSQAPRSRCVLPQVSGSSELRAGGRGRRPGRGCSCRPRCWRHCRRPLTASPHNAPSHCARPSRLPAVSLTGSAVLLPRRFPLRLFPLFHGAPRSQDLLKELCLPTSFPRGRPNPLTFSPLTASPSPASPNCLRPPGCR